MNTRALILALLVLAEGCSFVRPVQPALTPPAPPPNIAAPGPDRDLPAATPPLPDGAAPSTPPASPPPTTPRAPAVAPPALPTEKAPPALVPIITSRVPNEEELTREVNARLAKVSEIVDRIDPSKLTRDQRELFTSIQDFHAKARAALRIRDVRLAQILAEKALGLADNLAPR
jgi:type IV secretory pathway VirB10-like protein